jgi:hypothetical protein
VAADDFHSPWTRKHDDPRIDLIPAAPRITRPQSLEQLIKICRTRPPGERLKAAGSHWALSRAAISDHTFIETHDPGDAHPAMGKTLHNVVPGCLHRDLLDRMGVDHAPESRGTLVHVEAGKRIYQLYAELDQVDPLTDRRTLAGYINHAYDNPSYRGPWAFATLGGAGGQTVVGALNTGTHGGDFDRPPIADSVVAMHLVVDGGRHYWIESINEEFFPSLTDDDLLRGEFEKAKYGGPRNFEPIRDNDVFNAVLVSAGRFGVIYSVVLRAVPQYNLYERRRLHVWQDFKHHIKDLSDPLYTDVAVPPNPEFVPTTAVMGDCRFLQVAVSLTPHLNFRRNLAGITKRWPLALSDPPPGRAERVGSILADFDERIQAPLFANAGTAHPFSPDPNDPTKGADPGFLEAACANASFLRGVLDQTIHELEDFVESDGAVVGAGIGAVAAIGGIGLAAWIPALFLALLILKAILDQFDDDDRFGEHMENIKNGLLDPDEPDPAQRAAGLFAWQLINYLAFQSKQSDLDFEAISYAVMDRKDYPDISCETNVDSVEVFFSAVDDRLIAFVDALIAYEITQEMRGLACVGYAALRFMKPSRALLGMQKHDVTCAVEVAALKDVSGSQEMVDYAVRLALNPSYGGVLHWGQRNDYTMVDVERRYGDGVASPGGDLGTWREALSRLTANGRLDGFSSDFTRHTGLEVVKPKIREFRAEPQNARVGDTVTIHWDAADNPSDTTITLRVGTRQGWVARFADLPRAGSQSYQIGSQTSHGFGIEAVRQLNGVQRRASSFVSVTVG